MECEYRANLTQEEYEGLLPGEFRFDYESRFHIIQNNNNNNNNNKKEQSLSIHC